MPRPNTASEDYRKVKTVIDKAIDELKALGAEVVEPVTIPDVIDRLNKAYDGNLFETEPAINAYLAQNANTPVKTLREILVIGKGRAVTGESLDEQRWKVNRRCGLRASAAHCGEHTAGGAHSDG